MSNTLSSPLLSSTFSLIQEVPGAQPGPHSVVSVNLDQLLEAAGIALPQGVSIIARHTPAALEVSVVSED